MLLDTRGENVESGVAAASQDAGGLLRFDFFLHSWCTYKCFLKVLSNVPRRVALEDIVESGEAGQE